MNSNDNSDLQRLLKREQDLRNTILKYGEDVQNLQADLAAKSEAQLNQMRQDDAALRMDVGGLGLGQSLAVESAENLQDSTNALIQDADNAQEFIEAAEQESQKLTTFEKAQKEVLDQDLAAIRADHDEIVKQILLKINVNPEKLKHDGVFDREFARFFVKNALALQSGATVAQEIMLHIEFAPTELSASAIADLVKLGFDAGMLTAIANHQSTTGDGELTVMPLEPIRTLTNLGGIFEIYREPNPALEQNSAERS